MFVIKMDHLLRVVGRKPLHPLFSWGGSQLSIIATVPWDLMPSGMQTRYPYTK